MNGIMPHSPHFRLVVDADSSAIRAGAGTTITARLISDSSDVSTLKRTVHFNLTANDGSKKTIDEVLDNAGTAKISLTLKSSDSAPQLAGLSIAAAPSSSCLLFGAFGSIVVEVVVIAGTDGAALVALTPSLSLGNGAATAGACVMLADAVEKVGALTAPGDCTSSEHSALQADVESNCYLKNSCTGLTEENCSSILENQASLQACIAARNKINKKCFRGGNEGHIEALDNAVRALSVCQAKSQKFGCE